MHVNEGYLDLLLYSRDLYSRDTKLEVVIVKTHIVTFLPYPLFKLKKQ